MLVGFKMQPKILGDTVALARVFAADAVGAVPIGGPRTLTVGGVALGGFECTPPGVGDAVPGTCDRIAADADARGHGP